MTKEQKGSHPVKETNNNQGKAISKYKSGTERQKGNRGCKKTHLKTLTSGQDGEIGTRFTLPFEKPKNPDRHIK